MNIARLSLEEEEEEERSRFEAGVGRLVILLDYDGFYKGGKNMA